MDDKEFDEMMNKYVDSTRGLIDKDLSRLSDAKAEVKKKNSSKPFWITISAVLTIAIVLAITLPLTMQNTVGNKSAVYQITENDIVFNYDADLITVDGYEELMLPTLENVGETTTAWNLKENGNLIGIEYAVDIFDELIESISVVLLNKEYQYNMLTQYYNLANSVQWHDISIEYECEEDLYGTIFITYMYLEFNEYKYHFIVKSYQAIPIAELLDVIF